MEGKEGDMRCRGMCGVYGAEKEDDGYQLQVEGSLSAIKVDLQVRIIAFFTEGHSVWEHIQVFSSA